MRLARDVGAPHRLFETGLYGVDCKVGGADFGPRRGLFLPAFPFFTSQFDRVAQRVKP